MPNKNIFVTQPFLPPLEEFTHYLEKIWDSKILTNNGQFHQQLEKELAEYLGVKYLSLFSNGTIALITALKTLRISGEVITTPFSFVATAHSLLWNGIKPVFCDIDPITYNLDHRKIEALISPKTTAILPVHVYGNPCKVEEIGKIADNYGVPVIYDACHAFGVKYNGKSLMNWGDLSILSFHATKVFTTFEGGAIICHDDKTKKRIDFFKNFGFVDEVTVVTPGINGKMNEIQSAMGLLQLKYIDLLIEKRKKIAMFYMNSLSSVPGIKLMKEQEGIQYNYGYFPVLIDMSYYHINARDELYEFLKSRNIFSRRYFYPLISHFSMYSELSSALPIDLPVSELISKGILCLPIYPDLSERDQSEIVDCLQEYLSQNVNS
jgi:dTDP-4-amino-4,6-dideoxygalactose transaminase